MHYIYNKEGSRVGTVIALIGGFVNVAFSNPGKRWPPLYDDFYGTKAAAWNYLQHTIPGCTVKPAGRIEEEIARAAGGQLRGDRFAES